VAGERIGTVYWIPASCLEPEDMIFSGRDVQQPDSVLSCVLYICHSRETIWENSERRRPTSQIRIRSRGSGCLAMQNALLSHEQVVPTFLYF
jgi:hypothetical protein